MEMLRSVYKNVCPRNSDGSALVSLRDLVDIMCKNLGIEGDGMVSFEVRHFAY